MTGPLNISLMILVLTLGAVPCGVCLAEDQAQAQAIEDRYDTHGLRTRDTFVTDTTPAFLAEPEDRASIGEYAVAGEPPTVSMMVFPGLDSVPDNRYRDWWSHWGGITRGADDRFYTVVSDYHTFGCQIGLYEYDHAARRLDTALDVDDTLGMSPKTYSSSLVPGNPGIMPDGTLWGGTQIVVFFEDSRFGRFLFGSWLYSYDTKSGTGMARSVPVEGSKISRFVLDPERSRLVGTTSSYQLFQWDCGNDSLVWAGNQPDGMVWYRQGLLLDSATGLFWSVDVSDDRHRFMSYDPDTNAFNRYEVSPPVNPVTGQIGMLNAWTDRPARDGWFYCWSDNGMLFRFSPGDGAHPPTSEPVGPSWLAEGDGAGRSFGMEVSDLVLSPGGRYVYYFPKYHPAPVVRYDVTTGIRTVICRLYDHYFDTYGYWVGNCGGLSISEDGSSLVAVVNGAFRGREETPTGLGPVSFGTPALFVIDIPASERIE